jgi:hypothetical protein
MKGDDRRKCEERRISYDIGYMREEMRGEI